MTKKVSMTVLVLSLVVVLIAINNPVIAENKGNPKIGYVNMQRLFVNHPDKAISEEKLNQEAKKLQVQLEDEAKDKTKEERQELLEEYQAKLNNLEKNLVLQVMEDINDKVKEVAKNQDITVVLEKPTVLYGGYDLTQDVLDLLVDPEDQKTEE